MSFAQAAHRRKLMAAMKAKLDALHSRPEGKPRGIATKSIPNRLHLLDLPDETFTRLMHGILDEAPNSFLRAYLRWSSRGWPGPSVRMTRSYEYNAAFSIGTKTNRKTRIPRAL